MGKYFTTHGCCLVLLSGDNTCVVGNVLYYE